jgi:predicted secreted hydrolase
MDGLMKQHIFDHKIVFFILYSLFLASCAGLSDARTAEPQAQISAVEAASGSNRAGFAQATAPRPFVFPRDHGPHLEYATEWWYYTGNLDAGDGRHFGFQLTFFRSALVSETLERASDWAATNIYMAHFTVTDVAGDQFRAFDRFSRGAAGLAGASGEPYRVWLDDWSAEGSGPEGMAMRLRAAQEDVAIDLALTSERAPMLQGDRGLSQKGVTPGNASYYYSLTRMATRGTIELGGQRYEVQGLSWMDHEFGTSALEQGAAGWDWFGLQLSDGRDLAYARIRNADGRGGFAFGGLFAADGSKHDLAEDEITLEVLGTWRSQRSGVEYPSGWRLRAPSAGIDLRITPWIPDQELALAVLYWEGAVKVEGTIDRRSIAGNGYVELTGYAESGQDGIRVR